MELDSYRVLASPSDAEIKMKGSRFIAEAVPVESEEQAAAILAQRKRAFHDATHHCSAYRIGTDEQTFRWSDDGEPTGSAGRPILRQIDSAGLTNVLVVVTRYYGGVKLGTGGLARAYGQAAANALSVAAVETRLHTVDFRIRYGYGDTAAVVSLMARVGGQVRSTEYDDSTNQVVAVPSSSKDRFCREFTDAVSGRGECEQLVESS